ncbi:MAG: kinase [Draconibacterium sp.]|nr:MAG: kinase [Draconibacterium sp.]PIF06464.1 MAG: kinase [Draconibacterium sp.]
MRNNNKPILFILSGLPATGKSTLAKLITKEYKAFYLRIDTVEQGLRDLCDVNVQGEGYRLSYRIANDNLKLGFNVVADSCNPVKLTRIEWQKVAALNKASFINIEVICSDKDEHKKRVEKRTSDIQNLKLPTWEDINKRVYDTWKNERIIIDTAQKSVKEAIRELIEKVNKKIEK